MKLVVLGGGKRKKAIGFQFVVCMGKHSFYLQFVQFSQKTFHCFRGQIRHWCKGSEGHAIGCFGLLIGSKAGKVFLHDGCRSFASMIAAMVLSAFSLPPVRISGCFQLETF